MVKKRTYSLKPIRRDYTYSVYEIAEMYEITHDTVFRWVRNEGLVRIKVGKKYYVHSSDLIGFLKKKRVKNKKPCKQDEMFCCKCQKPQKPNFQCLKVKKQPNKTVRVYGVCASCSTRMNRVVSCREWSKTHPLYPNQNTPTTQLNGESV